MEFFVPEVDGSARMTSETAEKAWQACRKGAEGDAGQNALARRVYRLDYAHNGKQLYAQVGKQEPYYDLEVVMAIIAFPQYYKICCAVRGYQKVGDTPMVGVGSVSYVEDFTKAPGNR
ncbi:MAG TPA: hypothetical protein VFU16_08790 [Solirubrobacterales bacterium]|nr:hypothetical protein [Solirubrobacterales bacterium]